MVKKTTEQFIKEATKVHNNYYSYENSIYKSAREPIEIICPVHGIFSTRASNHLLGIRCRKCFPGNTRGVFNTSNAIAHKEDWINTPAWLYFLEIFDESERFFKVGLTTFEDINRRVKEFPKGYTIKILLQEEGNLYNQAFIEESFMKDFKFIKHTPLKDFRGKEECFKENPLDYYYQYHQEKFNN